MGVGGITTAGAGAGAAVAAAAARESDESGFMGVWVRIGRAASTRSLASFLHRACRAVTIADNPLTRFRFHQSWCRLA